MNILREEEQNPRKVANLFYFFLTTPDKLQSNFFDNCIHQYIVKILNLFDPELHLINTEANIKNKLNGLLSELQKFRQC